MGAVQGHAVMHLQFILMEFQQENLPTDKNAQVPFGFLNSGAPMDGGGEEELLSA